MAQQYYMFNPGYGQCLGTNFPNHESTSSQEAPAQAQSTAMDRVQGLSNKSTSTDNSLDSTWTKISWSSDFTADSTMSNWEQVTPPQIKYEDDPYKWEDPADTIAYSPTGSQGFSTPMLQPSSFTEPAIDSRPTPTSLRWNPHSRLLELYKLIVGKEEKEPYFQLFEGCAVTNQTPARVYLDYPKAPKKGSYPCQYPWGCSGKQTVFTRPADLDRHYKNVHASPDQKDSFPCDYAPCGRHLDPFTRKDHYRDHLRDYHKEDLGCAKMPKKLGRKVGPAEQAAWLSERKVSRRWWRCARCLVRRQVQVDGWECPNCKSSCEQDRIDARLKKQQHQKAMVVDPTEPDDEVGYQTASSVTTTVPSTAADPSTYYECGTCREYSGWVYDGIGEWNECPDCTTRVAEASYPVDDYYQ